MLHVDFTAGGIGILGLSSQGAPVIHLVESTHGTRNGYRKGKRTLAKRIWNQAQDSLLARITASTDQDPATAHPYRQDKTKLFI
ncbi:hypothetical protein PTTG_26131 [Puccinia triticina 1-1 BBBD Race 1]|uniref:Uncharacterized protein n=1 Tax=Puccinia triticina (isolate 1-1 / race 1 (BBBD)) TaxID=630390 RepID=A0A180GY83_PUCT1|nr:hypothetical protein PTTG_26131 [Puccinia triticina 1-1 BBBD Race 1]